MILHILQFPTSQHLPMNYAGITFFSPLDVSIRRCCAAHWGRGTSCRISGFRDKCMLSSSRISTLGEAGLEKDGSTVNRGTRQFEILCNASEQSSVGSLDWMSRASPYEVLGVTPDSSEEDIKAAFRARASQAAELNAIHLQSVLGIKNTKRILVIGKCHRTVLTMWVLRSAGHIPIKEYHPDVYQGLGDADAITQRLLRAYELLTGDVERAASRRKSFDPFEEPECVAEEVFVNELACIGRGCPYSCVERASDVFQFASDSSRARAVSQGKGGEYRVQLAVGQCPQNCIHYVTPAQRFQLEEILKRSLSLFVRQLPKLNLKVVHITRSTTFDDLRCFLFCVLEGNVYLGEVTTMDGLIARANFENGRYQTPKRESKKSEEWVDWY